MYQQFIAVGHAGADAQLRYTTSGTPVASFTLAVNKTWTSAEGERRERTTWFRISCWRKLAEIVGEHLTKGRQVLVVGEVEEAHAWTDQEGNPRATLEVTAQTVRFLGSRNGNTDGVASVSEPKDALDTVEGLEF